MKRWTGLIWLLLGLVLVACTTRTKEPVTATPTAIPIATPTPTQPPPVEPTPPTFATDAPEAEPGCTVRVAGLNLRAGPGTAFAPPLDTLSQGTELEPVGFSAAGFPEDNWILVRVRQDQQEGWVSASSQFVDCTVDPATLPLAVPPPTPTAVPQPTPELLAFVPVDGGGGEVANLRNDNPFKEGRNITLPGIAQSEVAEPMVFHDQIVFQVEVWDKSVGTADGEGIRHVEFVIRDGGQVVHERTENNAGYCVFGGGEPDCTVWVFSEHGNKWPSGYPVREGVRYDVSVTIVADSGETADWMWGFQVDLPW